MCAKCVSLCLCVFLILFLGLCFCFVYPIPICCFRSSLFYYYFLITCCFLLGDRRGVDPYGKEGGEEMGGLMGIRLCNQNMLYENNIHSIKEK